MDLNLTAKTALITGASMGIGAHVAETLAAEGVHLHLTARSAQKLETLKAEIAKTSDVSVTLHPLDLTSEGAPEALAHGNLQCGYFGQQRWRNSQWRLVGR